MTTEEIEAVDRLESEAMNISEKSRAILVERLIGSLGIDPDEEAVIVAEARRRIAEIESGAIETVSHEDAMAGLDRIINAG